MSDSEKFFVEGLILNGKFPQCVRSGYCCKKSLCPYGEWNEDQSQCRFLEGGTPGKHSCAKYDEIKDLPGSRDISPAFGAGCSSGMNDDRIELLRQRVRNG